MSTMSLGIKSQWLQTNLPKISTGIYLLDTKVEAIVNDVQRLGIKATVIEHRESFLNNALIAKEVEPSLNIINANPFERSFKIEGLHHFASIGNLLSAFRGLDVAFEFSGLYEKIIESLHGDAIIQLKVPQFMNVEKHLFELTLKRLGLLNEPVISFPQIHQRNVLWMYRKGAK